MQRLRAIRPQPLTARVLQIILLVMCSAILVGIGVYGRRHLTDVVAGIGGLMPIHTGATAFGAKTIQ